MSLSYLKEIRLIKKIYIHVPFHNFKIQLDVSLSLSFITFNLKVKLLKNKVIANET